MRMNLQMTWRVWLLGAVAFFCGCSSSGGDGLGTCTLQGTSTVPDPSAAHTHELFDLILLEVTSEECDLRFEAEQAGRNGSFHQSWID